MAMIVVPSLFFLLSPPVAAVALQSRPVAVREANGSASAADMGMVLLTALVNGSAAAGAAVEVSGDLPMGLLQFETARDPKTRRHAQVAAAAHRRQRQKDLAIGGPDGGKTTEPSRDMTGSAECVELFIGKHCRNIWLDLFLLCSTVVVITLLIPVAIRALWQTVGEKLPLFVRLARARGKTHMLVCAIDYKRTKYPLSCSTDGEYMCELQEVCGSDTHLHALIDSQCTKANLIAKIKSIGELCGPNDCFVFYFAGNGMTVPDVGGDEADQKEDALVCYFEGCVKRDAFWVDDEIAELFTKTFHKRTHVFVLADCVHSGLVCNFSKPCWKGRKAVSLVGCVDRQSVGECSGRGGIMTGAMLRAIERLQRRDEGTCYSVGQLFRELSFKKDEEFQKLSGGKRQDITLSYPEDLSPELIAWPLIPKVRYVSPMSAQKQVSSSSTDAWETQKDD